MGTGELVAASVGPYGEAIALWAAPAVAGAMLGRRVDAGGASFPDARTGRPAQAQVLTYWPDAVHARGVPAVELAYPMVQPLPGDRTLIVGARCWWRAEGAEQNAVVLDPEGNTTVTGTLGDGIEEVLTTPAGQIWVGYFDEGVFGNYGWGGPGPEPIGSAGIVRFGLDLTATWRYPHGAAGGGVFDAYALNVEEETAWSCYYADFPIVRIESGSVTTWRNEIAGARALLVGGEYCALYGGYGTDRNRVVVGKLTSDRFAVDRSCVLTLPDGGELGPCRVVARGQELHVFVERRWYRIDLDDLL